MLTIKEKVAKNYIDYPLNERKTTIDLELEGENLTKIEQCAIDNEVSLEEFIFMTLLEKLEENKLSIDDTDNFIFSDKDV